MNESDFVKIEIAGYDPEYIKTWISCIHVFENNSCNTIDNNGKIRRSRFCVKCRTPEYLIQEVARLLL